MIDAAAQHNVNLAVAYYARFFDKAAAESARTGHFVDLSSFWSPQRQTAASVR